MMWRSESWGSVNLGGAKGDFALGTRFRVICSLYKWYGEGELL